MSHALSELFDRLVSHRGKERITVGEVPVRGVWNHPNHARHLAQNDRVRAACPREFDARLNER